MTRIIHNHHKQHHNFAKRLGALINKFNAHLNIYYKMTNVSTCFQLKCATPTILSAKVMYEFTCR